MHLPLAHRDMPRREICKMTILNIIKRKDVGEGTGNMEEVDDLGFHQRYLELLEQRKKND